jgi:hypothetical protein
VRSIAVHTRVSCYAPQLRSVSPMTSAQSVPLPTQNGSIRSRTPSLVGRLAI